jgi:hypothetical protein
MSDDNNTDAIQIDEDATMSAAYLLDRAADPVTPVNR